MVKSQQFEFSSLSSVNQTDLEQILNIHSIVSVTDVKGNIIYVNDKFCEISGYKREELIGLNHRIVKSDNYSKEFYKKMWKTIANGETWHGLIENKSKNGSPYWVQSSIMPVLNDKGKPESYISIRTDISNEIINRKALSSFKNILDQTLDCVFTFDNANLKFTYVNQGAINQVGYSQDELLLMSPVDIKPDYNIEQFKRLLEPLSLGKVNSLTFETIHKHKSGKLIPVEIFLQYISGEQDQFIAIVRDITNREKLNHALKELSHAGDKDDVFTDITHVIANYFDKRWVGIGQKINTPQSIDVLGFWNDGKMGEQFSYPLMGTPCAEVCDRLHPIHISDNVIEQYPDDKMLAELGAVSYIGQPLLDEDKKEIGILWLIDDKPFIEDSINITFLQLAAKRIALEIQRFKDNKQLHNTFERISDGFLSIDSELHITYANRMIKETFGLTVGNINKEPIWDILPELASFFYKPINKAIKNCVHTNFEGYYPPANKWLSLHVYPSFDGTSIYIYDISEQKQLEEKRKVLAQQSAQSQKMEAIGQLVSGITHDFNNILHVIIGYSDLAMLQNDNDEISTIRKHLTEINNSGKRAADLISQMLSFAHEDDDEDIKSDPVPIIKETIKMLRSTFPAGVSIQLERDPLEQLHITISPMKFQRIIMNLCINAMHAVHGNGDINISIAQVQENGVCLPCGKKIAGKTIQVIVSDNGSGISQQDMTNIFKPFFTTKPKGKGTGMGLSIINTIVHECGGHIQVDSSKDKGTCFKLLFPAVEKPEFDIKPEILSDDLVEKDICASILLVDDEKTIVNLMKEWLKGKNYNVYAFDDSVMALEFFKKNHHNIDLLITDLGMPKLNGIELISEVQLIKVLPSILISGYVGELTKEESLASSTLLKPINRDTLISCINKLLSDNK